MPKDIVSLVQKENLNLDKELQDFKDSAVLQTIDEEYTLKIRLLDSKFPFRQDKKVIGFANFVSIYTFYWTKGNKECINDCKRIIL